MPRGEGLQGIEETEEAKGSPSVEEVRGKEYSGHRDASNLINNDDRGIVISKEFSSPARDQDPSPCEEEGDEEVWDPIERPKEQEPYEAACGSGGPRSVPQVSPSGDG